MDTNFSFLKNKKEFSFFAKPCMEAEDVLSVSPAVSAFASRRALELCVKWIYAVDNFLTRPGERETLQDLLHDHGFPSLLDYRLWRRLQHVVRNGNASAHSGAEEVSVNDAILSLNIVFDLVQWVDYCYGREYEERKFNAKAIPKKTDKSAEIRASYEKLLSEAKEEQDRIVTEKNKHIESLLKQVEELSKEMEALKKENENTREYHYAPDMSEAETRQRYIDADLKAAGYVFSQDKKRNCVETEYPVMGMPNASGTGFVDYVIWGDTGKIIALIEAKKASESSSKGRTQAGLYADCIENMQGYRPVMFYTNGMEINYWDDRSSSPVPRQVGGYFPIRDINRIQSMRLIRKPLNRIPINTDITDRHYQIRAVSKCCESYDKGNRKCLLVMATGTGKTRTAASLVYVLLKAGFAQRVLFLADRIELVKQAKGAFAEYIPDTPSCNLLLGRDDRGADIIFSTYPTMLHAIDNEKNSDGSRFFSPGHFDLIIVDEAHRSIFNKYRAIFEYFDAALLGLTATPKDTVDQSTYDFFDLPHGIPTDVYEYDEAVNKDKVLVPYYTIETATSISDDGITYRDLDVEEREQYEDDFMEDEVLPEKIPAAYINKYIFNQQTVDLMISDIMKNGIKHSSGNHVGKTIVFAQSKRHADFIIQRFESMYKEYPGFICKIVSGEPYTDDTYNNFKKKDSSPFIAVTVDKLETGVDIPEVVNLVFAKKVYSRIKFDQMIGRGTRLCKDLFGPGDDKKEFIIFDYMRNFQFFELHPKGKEAGGEISPVAMRFARKVEIIKLTQDADYSGDDYQNIRSSLVNDVVTDINALSSERFEVTLKRQYVDKYKDSEQFTCIDNTKKHEIDDNLAGLVVTSEKDEAAIAFDVLMYGLMISVLSKKKLIAQQKKRVMRYASSLLEKCATIPEVKTKIPELKEISADSFWETGDMLVFEETRKSLRGIMKYVTGEVPPIHYTNYSDEIVFREEGRDIDIGGIDYEEYRKKVNRYVDENRDNPAIKKLLRNEPINSEDYRELERIFTKELGSEDDYRISYQDTPFGILIRKIAKMDHDAAFSAFGEFIAEMRPNAEQMAFLEKVVDYIVENGCIENIRDLMNAPFDRPVRFSVLFTPDEQKKLVTIINSIKDNALVA